MILSKVKTALLALLATLSAALLAMVGLSRANRLKRTAKKLSRELDRAEREKVNRLYVKKIKIPIITSDLNRMFNDKPGEDGPDNDT